MLRVAAVMLVGVAFARPELTGGRRAVGRVVMVDRSRSVSSPREPADSASHYYQKGDVVFWVDSAAYPQRGEHPLASLGAETSSTASPRGSLSAALTAGMRAASSLRGDADSVELVLISPFAAEEWDAATSAIRAAWPGRVRLVRVAGPNRAASEIMAIDVRGGSLDDPVRATVALLPHVDKVGMGSDHARIERGSIASIDSTWTKSGAALVRWPAALDSSGWQPRARVDSSGAVAALDGGASSVVVAPFARLVDPGPGRVIARWADGSPAATERSMPPGCVRDVAIPLARTGDLALRESTQRLVSALASRCGGNPNYAPASDSALAQLRGTGPLVATRALESRTNSSSRLIPWLLAAALALLLIEPLLRRQRASA
jgi:hypothetical protein